MKIISAPDIPNLTTPKAGEVALKGFFKIADLWNLTVADQRTLLGELPKSTFHKYQKLPAVTLSRDLLERISFILGIYKSLRILLQDAEKAHTWIKLPNTAPPFSGQTALDRMLAGSITDLAEVRNYLDQQRGW